MFFAAVLQQLDQLRVGVAVEVDVQILVADHVGQQECLDLADGAVLRPLRGQVARAVERVGWAPLLDGFFAVEEDQVNAVALRRMRAEVLAQFDQQCGGAGAVVGADEADIFQRIVRLVVRAEDDDAVLLAGIT